MRRIPAFLLALAFLFVSSGAVYAQQRSDEMSEKALEQQTALVKASRSPIGPGVGMGLAIVGIGIGIGLIGHSALAGIARQPEQAGAIQGAMFILAGLVEGAGIIALVLCLVLVFL